MRGRPQHGKRRLKNEFAVFSTFISIIPTQSSLCPMYANSLGVEFLRILFKYSTQRSNIGTMLQPFETMSQQC